MGAAKRYECLRDYAPSNLLHGYRVFVNIDFMIVSFGDKATSDLFHSISSRKARNLPNQIHEVALYKLDVINAAHNLDDLKSPPGNRLEPLKGDLKGFHSVRINNQWRVAFMWESNAAHDVQIVTITNREVTYDPIK